MMTPDAGDIVILNFDPQAGREIQKRRPALVLSPKAFNAAMNFAVMCPITSTRSQHKMQLELPSGIKNFVPPGGGVSTVKIEQLRSLDFEARKAEIVAHVPDYFLMQCRSIAQRIIGL
jgi:mRNA interferase MazF